MDEVSICYVNLPEGKIPYMDVEFKKLKEKIQEPRIEWKFEATTFYDGTPVIYIKGECTDTDIIRITQKVREIGRLGKWKNRDRPATYFEKLLTGLSSLGGGSNNRSIM